MIGSVAIATSIATVTAIVSPVTANAATFTFDNIAGGDPVGDTINGQFSFSVVDGTGTNTGKTVWTFNNSAGGASSFINEIYFDWTTPLTIVQKTGGIVSQTGSTLGISGVEFKFGADPADLPQGGRNFNADIAIEPTTEGANQKGIDVGQQLVLFFNNSNEADISKEFLDGKLRVGIHVKGIGAQGESSDSYISAKPVPVPGFLLGVMAAGALGGTRLLKNKKQAV